MATVALPFIPSLPNYRVGTQLAGTTFLLDVKWNDRDAAWYFDILTESEVVLVSGIKVVLGTLLSGRSVNASLPAGVLQAVDMSNAGEEAGYDELGDRVQVYFYPFEDLG